MKVSPDGLGRFLVGYSGQRSRSSLLHLAQTAASIAMLR
jgi:hypothetical protein